MGSAASIYIFNDQAYRERVAPALQRFVHSGSTERWLVNLLRRLTTDVWDLDLRHIRALGFSFDQVCTYLDKDFSYSGNNVISPSWSSDWKQRACPSITCPAKEVCPLHLSRSSSEAEEFNRLLEACVVDQCLGVGQFVGRTVSPLWYADLLIAAGFKAEHPLWDLLRKLEYRGLVVGYQFSNSDGIHGWLSAAETKLFHQLVQGLDLPQFEPSFQAMKGFYRDGHYEAPPPYSFQQLSLAFLRTTAEIARAKKQGLLWGNDVLS
jgi:hypothetical protein